MARSYQDLLAAARQDVPEISVAALVERRAQADGPLVVDVREQNEWEVPAFTSRPGAKLRKELRSRYLAGDTTLQGTQPLHRIYYPDVLSLVKTIQARKRHGAVCAPSTPPVPWSPRSISKRSVLPAKVIRFC